MSKWRGGVIRSTQIIPSGSGDTDTATGVWRASDAAYWLSQNLWPGADAADPNFPYNVLLLSGNGTSNANNNAIVDTSPNNISFSRVGTPTVGSFSPYGTNWSNYFDGSGDYLQLNNNAALGVPTGDFTLEAWVYPTALNGQYVTPIAFYCADNVFSTGNLAYSLWITPSNFVQFGVYTNTVTARATSTITIPLNRWTHLAGVRSGNTTTLYINGVAAATGDNTLSGTVNNDSSFLYRIGAYQETSTTYYFSGYISNQRLVKGTALYTSNFTPPTSPLTAVSGTSLLTCQSNRFRDASTNNFAITRNGDARVTNLAPFNKAGSYNSTNDGGSLYYEGASYYESTFNGTLPGDFTIEMWIYPTASDNNTRALYTIGNESGGRVGWFLIGGTVCDDYYGVGTRYYGSGVLWGQWNHIALVRNGNANGVTAYVNGVAVGTVVNYLTGTLGNGNRTGLAGADTGKSAYMAGLRVVKGTALYTSNFTPPTTPPTAITNTDTLINFTNGGVIDATTVSNLQTGGTARINTDIKKFGTGSIYFDGSSWLYAPSKPENYFGTADFTIEGWFYYLNATTNIDNGMFGNYLTGWGTNTIYWGKHTTYGGRVALWVSSYSTGAAMLSDPNYPPANTWVHYAIVRNGSTWTMYRDGTSVASQTYSGDPMSTKGDYVVGRADATAQYFYGYIDDFRITRGVARYTSSFTPPSQALPTR